MDPKLFKEPQNDIPIVQNQFDLGNHSVTTIRGGELVPIFHQKIIPNTPFKRINAQLYGRFLTLLNPIMDEFDLFVYHFFVPSRIIFPQFDRFKAGMKKAKLDGTNYDPLPPRASIYTTALQSSYGWMQNALINSDIDPFDQLNFIGWWTNSLTDYLNFPSTNEISFNVDPYDPPSGSILVSMNDLPLYEWYDKDDVMQYHKVVITDGADTREIFSYFLPHNPYDVENPSVNYSTRRLLIEPYIGYTLIWYDYFRNWRLEDYKYSPYDFISEVSEKYNNDYTSQIYEFFDSDHDCLNFFKVRRRDFINDMFISAYPRPQLGDAVNIPQFKDFTLLSSTGVGGVVNLGNDLVLTDSNSTALSLNFGGNGAPTIDDLKKAEQAQKYLQLLMIHGIHSRDIDKMLYGASSTLPFDNPVYLGGEKLTFRFDEVIQTSSSTDDQPLGDFAGRGYVAGNSSIDNFTAEEYGYYFCIVCAVPHSSYYQGMPREYTRYFDYMELPNPLFANLGFDNILQEEVIFRLPDPIDYTSENAFNDNNTDFGYQTRYIDQRSHNNEIHGSFRSTLLNWHVARKFDTLKNLPLNTKFTNVDYKSFERIFAIQQYAYPNFLLEHKFTFELVQPLSYYCNPSV